MAIQTTTDFDQFVEVLRDLKTDFEDNPHTYPNEQTAVAETYARLRSDLYPLKLPATLSRTEYSDEVGALDGKSQAVPRVRPGVSFYDTGDERWKADDGMVWMEGDRPHAFDLAVFADQRFIQMRTTKTGPDNCWDLRSNQISVLLECRHSGAHAQEEEFVGPTKGVGDIRRLANTNGGIENRVFVFFDLLYDVAGADPDRSDAAFADLCRELEVALDERPDNPDVRRMPNPVHVFYLPRVGDMRHITVGEDLFEVEPV